MTKMNELIKNYLTINSAEVTAPQSVTANLGYLRPSAQNKGNRVEVVRVTNQSGDGPGTSTSTSGQPKCDLFYCDTGYKRKNVPQEQLLALNQELSKICKLAIKCRLHGVTGPYLEGEWTLSGFKFFKEAVEYADVDVSFISRDKSNCVTVQVTAAAGNCSELLLEKQFAVKQESDDELENANHNVIPFIDETSDEEKLKRGRILACDSESFWVSTENRDAQLETFDSKVASFFGKIEQLDQYAIKKPEQGYVYLVASPVEGTAKAMKRGVILKSIKDGDQKKFVLRMVDSGSCELAENVYAYPQSIASEPIMTKSVNILPKSLLPLISPFTMFYLSLPEIKNEISFPQVDKFNASVNGKKVGDLLLELNSKQIVENITIEADQIELKVIEMLQLEEKSDINPVFSAIPVDGSEKRDKLQTDLNEFYNKHDKEIYLPNGEKANPLTCEKWDVNVGSYVVVKKETDNESSDYYRVEIIKITDEDNVQVFNIDYGSIEGEAIKNLRKLIPIFSGKNCPATTLQCVIVDTDNEKVSELVDTKIKVALLHLGRINIVTLDLEAETAINMGTKFQYPKMPEIQPLKQQINVTRFETPLKFAYNLKRFETELNNLNEEIFIGWEGFEFADDDTVLSEGNVAEGTLLACHVNEKYYRAQLKKQEDPSSENKIEFIFIDYDISSEYTETMELRKLPNYLAQIPPLCSKIEIRNLVPIEGDSFVQIENEIAKKHIAGHICTIENIENPEVMFNGKTYSEYLVQNEIASRESKAESLLSNSSYKWSLFDIDAENTSQQLAVSGIDKEYLWVQIQSRVTEIDIMQNHVAAICNEKYISEPESGLRRPLVGKICASRFSEDGMFYRAEIIDAQKNGPITVRFVDFGNTEKTTQSELIEWNKDCSKVLDEPRNALRVTVPKMFELMNWDVLNYLQENLFMQNVTLKNVKVSQFEEKLAALSADVMFNGQNLIEIVNFVKSNPKVTKEDLSSLRSIDVKVTHVEQIPDDVLVHIQNVEKAAELDSLMDSIRNVYENIHPEKLQIEKIEVGDFLVVKWSEDEEFYRGKLIAKLDDDQYRVLLIDFGNTIDCASDKCWKLDHALAKLPPFSFCCSLFNCKPLPGKIVEAVKYLETTLLEDAEAAHENASEKKFKCEVQLRVSKPYRIDLMVGEAWLTDTLKELELAEDENSGKFKFPEDVKIPPDSQEFLSCFALATPSPDTLALQIGDEENVQFSILQEDLNHYYAQFEGQKDETIDLTADKIMEGMLVIAYDSEYESFCRGEVKSVLDSSYQVYMVDWARETSLELKDLKQIKKCFAEIMRPQALIVKLAGVIPDEDDKYLASDEFVVAEVLGENELQLTQVDQNEGGYPSVNVKIQPGDLDLKDQLIESGICREIGKDEIEWPKIREGNSVATEIYGISDDTKTEVVVASLTKEGIFAQFENHLKQVENLLTEYSSNQKLLKKIVRRPKVGKYCVTKFVEDQNYYRAQIEEIVDETKVKVVFIDYRNEQVCNNSEIYEVTQALIEIPSCCVKFQFSKEVQDLINWDVEQALTNSITINAEAPKSCSIQIKEINEESPIAIELFVSEEKLIDEIRKIRSHPKVSFSSFTEPEVADMLVVNFENLEKMYLIPKSSVEKKDKFNVEMTKFYNHLSNPEELKIEFDDFEPGSHIVYNVIPDDNPLENRWCRASVETVSKEDRTCNLRLLDTGACLSNCKIERCRKLNKDFATKEPTFVTECKLFQVENTSAGADKMKSRVLDLIKAFDKIPLTISVLSRISEPQAIDIYLDETKEKTLTEALIGEDIVQMPESCEKYPELEFTHGAKVPVTFILSESPVEIIFQLVESNDKLLILEEDLRASLDFLPELEDGELKSIKTCLAQSPDPEDNQWYRAIVLSVAEATELATVKFVDWGNSCQVKVANLRKIPKEFCELPVQALSCAVDDIIPFEGTQWVNDDNEILAETLGNASEISITLKNDFISQSEANVVDVTVDGENLAVQLGNEQVARAPGSPESEIKKVARSKFTLEDNSELVVWVSAIEPVNYFWNFEQDENGKVIDIGSWKKCKVAESILKDEQRLDKNFVWLQLDSNDEQLNEMNATITKNSGACRKLRRPKAGKIGLAKSELIGSWIRVEILTVSEKEDGILGAEVRAIDYGHREVIENIDDVKQLPEYLYKKPCFALSMATEYLDLDSLNIDTLEELQRIIVFNQEEEVTVHVTSIDEEGYYPVVIGTLTFREKPLKDLVIADSVPLKIEPRSLEESVCDSLKTRCIISHAESPESLCVQKSSAWSKMNSMLDQLNKFYNDLKPGRFMLTDIESQSFCAFQVSMLSKTKWKRGQIISMKCENGDECQVKDVDTGLFFNVQKASLKKLKSEFCGEKAFAIEVGLFGVSSSSHANEDGSMDVSGRKFSPEEFTSLVNAIVPASGEVLLYSMSSLGSLEESKLPKVLLEMDQGVDLSMLLIEKKLASRADISKDTLADLTEKCENVSEGSNVSCVYVQVESPTRILLQIESTNEVLIQLELDMTEYYKVAQLKDSLKFEDDELKCDGMCAVFSDFDKLWHRATVAKLNSSEDQESENIEVFLIDWGTKETVSKSSVMPLLAEFVSVLPPQCVIVELASIVPDEPDEDWIEPEDTKKMAAILESVEDAIVTVKVAMFDQKSRVAVADILLAENKSVCDIAVNERGFASFKDSEKSSDQFKLYKTDLETLTKANAESIEVEVSNMDLKTIYVSTTENKGKADELLESINKLIAEKIVSDCLMKELRRPKAGKDCIVMENDTAQYYRAQIERIIDESQLVNVYLVDYGVFNLLDKSKCFQITEGSALQELVKSQPKLSFKLKNEIEYLDSDIEDEFFEFISDENGVPKIMVKIATEDFVEPFKIADISVKGQEMSLERFAKSFHEPIFELKSEISKLEENSEIVGGVSMYASDRVYVQLKADYDQIDAIQADLAAKYGTVELDSSQISISRDMALPGAIVACKSALDEAWYRAEIVELPSNDDDDEFKVIMIDYGFVDNVKLNALRVLVPEFHEFHKLAVPCVLTDVDEIVKNKDGGYSHDSVDKVIKKYVCEPETEDITAVVHDASETPWKVSFKLRSPDGEKTLADLMK